MLRWNWNWKRNWKYSYFVTDAIFHFPAFFRKDASGGTAFAIPE
jgi:hypothetical protein